MDMLNISYRRQILNDINSEENRDRKAESLKQSEIFSDRLFQYVREELRRHFSEETVNEMPIVSFINFLRRIVKQEASIYKDEPVRRFFANQEMSDEQEEAIQVLYKKIRANVKLKKSNQKYKLQDQSHLMIVPVNGKIKVRALYSHQIDAIPDARDPEQAAGYIVSAFDKNRYLTYQKFQSATGFGGRSQTGTQGGSDIDLKVADKDDYKKSLEYYTYWDKEYNFVFNGRGEIIDPATRQPIKNPRPEDVESPIPGIIPIIDISMDKDLEYFIRSGMAVTDFSTQYNATMSDVWHISRMQGYSIGVIKGPEGLIPQSTRLGPNLLLHLKTNPDEGTNAGDIDFQFVSPSPDIAASLSLLETMLMNFISSRGLDPKEIATDGSKDFNSALERMLAMIDQFEATKDDFDLYERVEEDFFEIIKAWVNNTPDQLNEEFRVFIPEDAKISVKFAEPQMVQTRQEKVKYWQERIDIGLATRTDAIMEIEGLTRIQAQDRIKDIDGEETQSIPR